ncbi:unannotated protein [freshwater metagenome]|uniref:Unannotated protein n=1 Tax=freshwater metagenome TaxID=449393 RepID=A0A6J6MH01_9ZZZZ
MFFESAALFEASAFFEVSAPDAVAARAVANSSSVRGLTNTPTGVTKSWFLNPQVSAFRAASADAS